MQQLISRPSLHGFGTISRFGLGASTSQLVSGGTSVAGTIASATLAPTVAATLGITAAVAIPIIGAAVAAIGFGIEAILNSGCGQSCVITSDWANQAESQLQQNIAAYFAIPAPRPQSVQQAALANFDTVWNYLEQQCSQVAGAPGENCISDRQAGACKWHQTTTPPWGSPVAGACWNWLNGYRDPIANDPNALPDEEIAAQNIASSAPAATSASDGATLTLPASLPSWLPLAAAAGLSLFAAMGD